MTSTPAPQPSARFRPATDFPRSITGLERSAAESLYAEMRDCLIFTNRSRGQLIRRNQEYRNTATQLQADVQRLQALIRILEVDRIQLEASKQQVIAELQAEFTIVSRHLDELSSAFDEIQDFDESSTTTLGLFANAARLVKFLKRIRTIVQFWRQPDPAQPAITHTEQDRRDRPQMYDDSASNGRSLLDR
ncbi:hypothetical protein [Synechococcus elongatus]|uniref:hypothetical protein n=1 Tax=Synechococcus elongatus TaxID=32046 RepID=UPI0030CFBF8D